jgi:ubiquitin-conjugating enzyme E2 Z
MSIYIKKETIQRLVSDVKNLKKEPLHNEGIYYAHDETDMLKGYAMIIGPEDTPYFGGYYLFQFEFPSNYPFAPPKVTYETNNGYTRFHPNLYISGKVCLSMLNTWEGEKWSSVQTIRSVLLTIHSILNSNPLLNEPGITETHRDISNYNEIISYVNIKTAILDIVNKKILLPKYEVFYPDISLCFDKNKEKLLERIKEKQTQFPNPILLKTYVYSLKQELNYTDLEKIFLDNNKIEI